MWKLLVLLLVSVSAFIPQGPFLQPGEHVRAARDVWNPANGRNILAQRKVSGPTYHYFYFNESTVLDNAIPSEHTPTANLSRISNGYFRRIVYRCPTETYLKKWEENPFDSATLEIKVTGLSGGATDIQVSKYISSVTSLSGYTLSHTTWNCPEDSNLRDGIPICSSPGGQQPGGAHVDFGHTFKVKTTHVGTVISIPITRLVETNPTGIMIWLVDEDDKPSRGDEYIEFETSSARIVIKQEQATPGTSLTHTYPGCKRVFKTVEMQGEDIAHHAHFCKSRKKVFGTTPTVVQLVGVPFTADVGAATGAFYPDYGFDEIIITQHCAGQSGCHSSGNNSIDFRIELMVKLLFGDGGFELEPGSVALVGHDQGSALAGAMIRWAFENGYNFFESYFGWEDWSLAFYCAYEEWIQGGFHCSRAFFGKALVDQSPGFYQFALCSQHGLVTETNPQVSCRAKLYDQYDYWCNFSATDPAQQWDGSYQEQDVRSTYTWLDSLQFDPGQTGFWPHNSYDNFVYIDSGSNSVYNDLATEELTLANSYTKAGHPQFQLKKHAQGQLANLIPVAQEDFEAGPNSVFNPTGDPYGMKMIHINQQLGVFPESETEIDRMYRYMTGFSEMLLHNVSASDPNSLHFFYAVKPGLFKFGCTEAEALVIDGRYTGINGQPVCGHAMFGDEVPNVSPVNRQYRYDRMATSHDASEWFTPAMCHADLRCTLNAKHAAEMLANRHGQKIRAGLP